MSNENRIRRVPAGRLGLLGPGDQIRFIFTGAETGGAFLLAEVLVPSGGGPLPHIHDLEVETVFALVAAAALH